MDFKGVESYEWTESASGNFTGPVWLARLSEPSEPGGVAVLGVHFLPGSRTHWHSHPGGQVLHVTAGLGLVGDESGGRTIIKPGDTVTTPPNQMHWHGASKDSPMTHLSVTSGGPASWPGRPVTDSEYSASDLND